MSSDVQRPDDSPSTSGGSSDIEQRESVPAEQEREQAQPKKKETKISSKTAAKLSTSAKRYKRRAREHEPGRGLVFKRWKLPVNLSLLLL